mgnify:CR=1 FL=1|tara:strand:- start:954 stop:1121 length:168 start_codon:yes stop_codon:yes gene_type:complete
MKNKKHIINRLEWYDSGDGIEYEIWIDTETEKLYNVPIEIVINTKLRDWENIKEI